MRQQRRIPNFPAGAKDTASYNRERRRCSCFVRQIDIAKAVGVSKDYIGQYERGELAVIARVMLKKIERAYDTFLGVDTEADKQLILAYIAWRREKVMVATRPTKGPKNKGSNGKRSKSNGKDKSTPTATV